MAALQGALGGVIFWLLGLHAPVLWGVVMGLLALLPAVGAAVIWVPAAIYLLAIGAVWQGVVLLMFGAFVIGLVDNILRPLLVGKDTKLPDYVVLISTLGGLATFGLNGFVLGPIIAAMFIAAWDIFSDPRLRGTTRRRVASVGSHAQRYCRLALSRGCGHQSMFSELPRRVYTSYMGPRGFSRWQRS